MSAMTYRAVGKLERLRDGGNGSRVHGRDDSTDG